MTSSIYFSRTANIVANKKNNILAWGLTSIVLVYVIIQLLAILIDDFTISNGLSNFIDVAMIATALVILIFEIPQANSFHGTYQKLIVFIILITCGLGYGYYTKIKQAEENFLETFDYNEYSREIEEATNLYKFFTCGVYISLGAFLINPMLRVRYSDNDYSNVDEIDKILTGQTTYQNASIPNPNAVLNQTYQNTMIPGQQSQYAPHNMMAQQMQPPVTPMPVAPQAPVETTSVPQAPTEKVVNPNFKQEDIPEAIIPSLDFGDPIVEQTPTPVTEDATTPTTDSTQPNTQ